MNRQWLLVFAGPALILALVGSFCRGGRQQPEQTAETPAKRSTGPKVLQFYASPPAAAPGERVLLCYGVEDAQTVRIEPAVEPVNPSYSRCIQATPKATTRYTLTAEGEAGRTATATVTVTVRNERRAPPAPPPVTEPPAGSGPEINAFRTETKNGPGGPITLLCYEVHGAEAVAIEPGVLPRSGALRGCLGVAPEHPTTYFLTAYGPGCRTARRALTVNRDNMGLALE